MLTEQCPSDVLIKWAETANIVHDAMDRPWFHANPPVFLSEIYPTPCRCHTMVKLTQFPCEDGGGYIYLGQCDYCQTAIWSFIECSGK